MKRIFQCCLSPALLFFIALAHAAIPSCDNCRLDPTADFAFVIGSSGFHSPSADPESGSTYRWLSNGIPFLSGSVGDLLQLPFDGSPDGVNGELPATASLLAFAPGRFGEALALTNGSRLQFSRTNNLDVSEGTIEFWVSLPLPGSDPVYTNRSHTLFHYRAANGEDLVIAQSSSSGVLYGGGTVQGQWQSAYSGRASMLSWPAHQWHHVALTFSASNNVIGFYLDGVLTASNNEGHYWPPASTGPTFAIGGNVWGANAVYLIDSFHILGRALAAEEIAARARRATPPRPNEVWLPATSIPWNQPLVYEFTPATPTATGTPCTSAPLVFRGIPIVNPVPADTLLAPGTTELELALDTATNTACAWSLNPGLPFAQMTPFNAGAGTTHHSAHITGLNPDPFTVNTVHVRCASDPDFVLSLRYRSLSEVCPSFPRTGNLWGWWQVAPRGTNFTSKIDLWLGVSLSAPEILQLRQQNPHAYILTSINAVENSGLPTDFYLKDVHGNRIEVWPGSYRLNLTKTNVAEYQAQFARQSILDSDLMADGVFFDNVMTSQSWQNHDIFGNPVQIDADEDGQPDDPAQFDARWKAGVFHELRTFRRLMPQALSCAHSLDLDELDMADLFNGKSLGFSTANVIEGEQSFATVWDEWAAWHTRARSPHISMIESSPVDQIAYGYDYDPLSKIPPSTLEFAKSFYPWMRFGLALTLMQDGYFAHEFGDTHHGNDWWYDELDYNLGYPLGPAQRIEFPSPSNTNLLTNPDFETNTTPWRLALSTGAAGTLSRDPAANAPSGTACARIDVTAITGTDWHVTFGQWNRTIEQGTTYDLLFWARSSAPRSITLSSQKGAPDWRGYGLGDHVSLGTNWQEFSVPWTATESASDARIQFFLGTATGTVWFDDIRVVPHPPDVWRRDFTRGVVLLNGTTEPRTVQPGTGLSRLTGPQAPMTQVILDDTAPTFSVTGTWTNRTIDTAEWLATGPFYHAWAGTLHERGDASGTATWLLPIETNDTYTVEAWWPAAPEATNWTHAAIFAVLSNNVPLATATLNQSAGGDEWHAVATVPLSASATNSVRLSCPGGTCVADALLLSSAGRYNNGQPASAIQLARHDGIVLRRDNPTARTPRIGSATRDGSTLTLWLTNLTPGLVHTLESSAAIAPAKWLPELAFTPQLQSLTTNLQAPTSTTFLRIRTQPE